MSWRSSIWSSATSTATPRASWRRRSQRAINYRADVVLLPELAVSGYPPEDLLFHSGMRLQVARSLERLKQEVRGITLIAGYPEYAGREIFNSAIVIRDGAVLANHRKACLPNYRVFDEKRYFTPGTEPTVVELNGIKAGVLVCEDVWDSSPARQARAGRRAGAAWSSMPRPTRSTNKRSASRRWCARGSPRREYRWCSCNLIGGQDELVFDGNSFVMDAKGTVTQRAPAFTEGLYVVDLAMDASGAVKPVPGDIVPLQGQEESVYGALVQGTRDYVDKHRFPGVVLGLSGGVDSALTLVHRGRRAGRGSGAFGGDALALHLADEQGRRRAAGAVARRQAQRDFHRRHVRGDAGRPQGRVRRPRARHGGGEYSVALPRRAADGHLQQDRQDAADHRQQERDGGGLRHAVRRHGRRLRADQGLQQTAGVPAVPPGATPSRAVIPARVIERPPSAELRYEQKDTDSLPPYEILDPILEAFIEEDLSVDQITARGFDRATVGRILDLVKRNEYKRRQAPPGVRVSGRAFGRDWRYPITSGYKSH